MSEPAFKMLLVAALAATLADWFGSVVAIGVAAPLMRMAAGQSQTPLAGAAEAGLLSSAAWLAFEA